MSESSINYFIDGKLPTTQVKRFYLWLALGIVFAFSVLIPLKAHAVSYSYNGTCYGDTPSALANFQAKFPNFTNGIFYQLTSASISTTGLITYVSKSNTISGASLIINPSATLQLPVCTSGLVSNGRSEFMLVSLALVALFVFGFSLGKGQFSKNFAGGQS